MRLQVATVALQEFKQLECV